MQTNAKERKLWLMLSFMIRSCILPQDEFELIPSDVILNYCHSFYKLYEQLFGPQNCTYNTHILCAHLLQMRNNGPLSETSAFPFESFYGELRNSFTPGTNSTLKQIFSKSLLKRSLAFHSCSLPIHISNKDTALECNSLVYTKSHNCIQMYKIIDIEDDVITCYKQGKITANFNELPNTNWSSIGVFEKGALTSQKTNICATSISGKVLKVNNFLITCPKNILKEL